MTVEEWCAAPTERRHMKELDEWRKLGAPSPRPATDGDEAGSSEDGGIRRSSEDGGIRGSSEDGGIRGSSEDGDVDDVERAGKPTLPKMLHCPVSKMAALDGAVAEPSWLRRANWLRVHRGSGASGLTFDRKLQLVHGASATSYHRDNGGFDTLIQVRDGTCSLLLLCRHRSSAF